MKRFLILIHGDDEAFAQLSPEEINSALDALHPFEETVVREGALISTQRLHPARTSTLVQYRNGVSSTVDGPFTETKEQLGGYYLVAAKNLEQVLDWTKLIPPLMDSDTGDTDRSLTRNGTCRHLHDAAR